MFVVKTLKLSNWTSNSGNSHCSAWAYSFYFWLESHLTCHWAPLKRAWIHLLYTFPSAIYKIDQMHSEPSLLWAKWSQLSQPFSERWSRFLIIFVALQWTLFRSSTCLLYWGAQNCTQYSRCSLTSTGPRGNAPTKELLWDLRTKTGFVTPYLIIQTACTLYVSQVLDKQYFEAFLCMIHFTFEA